MNAVKISRYSRFARPALFVFAFFIHAAIMYVFSFKSEDAPVETVDFREAEVFKLVDVQEFVPPPPEVKEAVTVAHQPKASETIMETKEEVREEQEEIL